jgi:hypothetical protein
VAAAAMRVASEALLLPASEHMKHLKVFENNNRHPFISTHIQIMLRVVQCSAI